MAGRRHPSPRARGPTDAPLSAAPAIGERSGPGPENTLRSLAARERWILIAVTAAGAGLRLAYQAGRSFAGDEAGTLQLLHLGYGELLTRFTDPWRTMNAYLALIKAIASLAGPSAWALVAPSLLAGVAAVPLTAAIALRLSGPRTALFAAALVAGNPYLVRYSAHLRSYMLLLACCLASLLFLLEWRRRGRWRDGAACATWAALAALMHANAVYFHLFLALLAASWWLRGALPAPGRRAAISLLVPGLAAVAVAAAAYAPLWSDIQRYRAHWSHTPPSSLAYVPWVLREYFADGLALAPSLALAAWGLYRCLRRRRPGAALALGVAVPVATASLLGVSVYPWAWARFLIVSLPLLILWIGEGADALPGPRWLGALAVAGILVSWAPGMCELFIEKRDFPWREVAAYLRSETRPEDGIATADFAQVYPEIALAPLLGGRRAQLAPVGRYLRPARAGSAPGRLFVVSPNAPIETDASQRSFGAVQVVTYAARTRRGAAERLLADLERSVGTRVAPELTGLYRMILALHAALGLEDPDGGYAARYRACAERTERQRHLPPQLREPRAPEDRKRRPGLPGAARAAPVRRARRSPGIY